MDFIAFQNIVQNNNRQDNLVARFYDKAIKTEKLNADGLPIFINRCFVEIRIKDNNCEIYDQPATPEKIRQFPVEYARYQLGKKQIEEGTPLEQFAFLSVAEIESLKVRGIFTVEALASAPTERIAQLKLVNEQNLVKKFIANAKNNHFLAQWQKKEENYLAEIKSLKEIINELKKNSIPKHLRRK